MGVRFVFSYFACILNRFADSVYTSAGYGSGSSVGRERREAEEMAAGAYLRSSLGILKLL